MSTDRQIRNHAGFIWSVADKLRGVYKQSEYGRVILPFVVLRRLDCVLEPTKAKVLETAARLEGRVANVDPVLRQVTGEQFFNTSQLDLRRLLDDPNRIADNLLAYIAHFSPAARDVLDKFDFRTQIDRLDRAGPALPRRFPLLRDRPASRGGQQPGDGLPIRGADPPVLGALQRDSR